MKITSRFISQNKNNYLRESAQSAGSAKKTTRYECRCVSSEMWHLTIRKHANGGIASKGTLSTIRVDFRWWFGKVSAIVKPDGTCVEYEYNPLGQLARKVAKQESRITNDGEAMKNGTGNLEQKTANSSALRESPDESGQVAKSVGSATTSHPEPRTKTDSIGFYWDGLALLQRGDESSLCVAWEAVVMISTARMTLNGIDPNVTGAW